MTILILATVIELPLVSDFYALNINRNTVLTGFSLEHVFGFYGSNLRDSGEHMGAMY